MKSAFGEVVSQTSQFFLSSSKSSPRVKTVNLQDVAELVELCDGDVATPECDPAQHGECEIADTGLDLAADCQREAGPAVRARHLPPILRLQPASPEFRGNPKRYFLTMGHIFSQFYFPVRQANQEIFCT